jgi:hypothetical protein
MFTHYSDIYLGPEMSAKRKKYERILLKIHGKSEIAMYEQGELKILSGETLDQAYCRHHKEHLKIISKYDRYETMLDKAYRNIINKIGAKYE